MSMAKRIIKKLKIDDIRKAEFFTNNILSKMTYSQLINAYEHVKNKEQNKGTELFLTLCKEEINKREKHHV